MCRQDIPGGRNNSSGDRNGVCSARNVITRTPHMRIRSCTTDCTLSLSLSHRIRKRQGAFPFYLDPEESLPIESAFVSCHRHYGENSAESSTPSRHLPVISRNFFPPSFKLELYYFFERQKFPR